MEPARNIEEYEAQIQTIRQQAHKRRSEAWAMVPETVLGIELNPITPAIHTLLVGTGNAYVTGNVPGEADLRNFVWFCSQKFNPDHPNLSLRWKWWVMLKLRLAINRGATRKNRPQVILRNFYTACEQVHEILANTFSDGCSPGNQGKPLAAALEAQVIDMFAREYKQWPMPNPVRHTPIKQLYQLARCIDRRNLGKEDNYFDPREDECTRSFLAALNSRN